MAKVKVKKTDKLDIAKESQKIFAEHKAGKITEKQLDDRFEKLEQRIAAEKK